MGKQANNRMKQPMTTSTEVDTEAFRHDDWFSSQMERAALASTGIPAFASQIGQHLRSL